MKTNSFTKDDLSKIFKEINLYSKERLKDLFGEDIEVKFSITNANTNNPFLYGKCETIDFNFIHFKKEGELLK